MSEVSGTRYGGHRGIRRALLAVELFVGVWAIYGAIMLVTDVWRMPLTDLAPLPLHSWVVPGIALLLVVAVPMLVAAALVWRGGLRAADASIAAGTLLVGWILVQLAVIGPQMFLQPVLLLLGSVTAILGWRLRHRAAAR